MRTTYLGAILTSGLIAGAALAASHPPASGADTRWRPWTGYEPPAEPSRDGPAPPAIAEHSCVAFENDNYGGRRLEAHDGAAYEYVGRPWNDRISSLACAPGCRLIAYQTIVFGGARANFTGARPALGPIWNDRISALRVSCGENGSAEGEPAH